MKRIGFLGMVLAGVFSLSAGADPAFVDLEHSWFFPQKLGGVPFNAVEKYNNTDLGYTIYYGDGDTFQAVVSVYTLGRPSIPDGCKGEDIDMVLKSVESPLQLRQKQEQISGLKKRGTTVVPKQGDIQFVSVVYQYADIGTNTVQNIQASYATGIRNHFVKLQFTFDLLDGKRAQPMAEEMIDQLIAMFKTESDDQEILLACCSVFLQDPAGYSGRAAAQYFMGKAQVMENLNVYTHLFIWPDGYSAPKNVNLLIAAYFAGMLQIVVPQQLDAGGEFEAFCAMLDVYQILRAEEQIDAISELDAWVRNSDKKALFDQLLIEE